MVLVTNLVGESTFEDAMTLAKRSPGKAAVVCVANPADGDPRVFVVLTEEVLRELGKALEKV